jgi:hypothetical protein
MESTSIDLTAVSGAPGEASHQDIPSDLMLANWNAGSGAIDVSYTPACDATDHTIYYGDLASIAGYSYAGQACFVGANGTTSFDPAMDSVFFLVVANDAVKEGSYGEASGGAQRPEALGLPTCDYLQDLASVTCE